MAEKRKEWVFRARVRVFTGPGEIGFTKMEAILAVREMDRLYSLHNRLHRKPVDRLIEVHELEDPSFGRTGREIIGG